jgi:murein DD-endopeptidase MepM/ murein hydrolase activator NlpD
MPGKRQRRQKRLPRSRSPRRGSVRLGVVLIGLVVLNLYVFLWRDNTSIPDVREAAMAERSTLSGAGPTTDDGEPSAPRVIEESDADSEGRWVDGEVVKGDSLGRILRREGLTPPEADKVIRALRDHLDFRKIRVGQSYRLHFDDTGVMTRFEFRVSRVIKVEAVRGEDGVLAGARIEAETEVRTERIGGSIESSLYTAIKDMGEDTRLVGYLVDIFAYDLNFYIDQHKGDSFRLLIDKEYLNGEFLRYRRIKAAEYSGKAGTFRVLWYRYPDGKREAYFDDQGRAVVKTFLKTPLKYSRISGRFNRKRMHPILHKQRAHLAVDYAARTGTPIWAAASGKITHRGWKGGGGNTLILRHGNGLQTVYMHLSKFRKGQRVGQQVKQKTVIGYVGSTGMSTGAHLHFMVKKNGKYIDPLKMKMTRGPGVAKKHRADFDRHASALVAELVKVPVKSGAAAPGAE